ncbi:MAG: VWA domain-containing protein [Chloroflexi bacterium]|nr:MAG: VWA domain-containing protein [Chloroflexota bacterium]
MTYSGPETSSLPHNLVLFGRVLRKLGIESNANRIQSVISALQHIDIGSKADFFYTVRCLLVQRAEDLPIFDKAFSAFWVKPKGQQLSITLPSKRREQDDPLIDNSVSANSTTQPQQNNSETVLQSTLVYSPSERLHSKDFAELTSDEIHGIKAIIANTNWNLGLRRSRRKQRGMQTHIDWRRTVRQSLHTSGEIFEWARRDKKQKPRPIVILADISGSMEVYSRILLHFIYALNIHARQKVEAFVFSTRLTHITRQLKQSTPEVVFQKIGQHIPDWSGGTRIGAALKDFNFTWARRVSSQSASVLIISDGWDRGELDLLRTEISRLQRSSFRLIWLNPLLGDAKFKPKTRGLQAALPHIDDFLPIHNLNSLHQLAATLRAI